MTMFTSLHPKVKMHISYTVVLTLTKTLKTRIFEQSRAPVVGGHYLILVTLKCENRDDTVLRN